VPDTSVSLLLRLRRGSDQTAWERFVELYTPLMYGWATRLGAQDGDACDLVQDVLVILFRVLPTFDYDRERSFRSWLRTVVTNKWRERWRKLAPTVVSADVLDGLSDGDVESSWDDAQERAELCRQALGLIREEFSPTTWAAFVQTAVEGRPVTDVCAELGLSANAVYLARSRVLSRLRQELAGLWE
jgi:RNA polymerase sigma-70 factor (ECF subfamily)